MEGQTVEVVVTCAPNKKTQKLLECCPRGPLESADWRSIGLSSRAPFHLPHLRTGCGVGTGGRTRTTDSHSQRPAMTRGRWGLWQEGQSRKVSLGLERKLFGSLTVGTEGK